MKKQVKKFMSALLACVMVAVSVIVFDMNPVHAASGAITEASGWLETDRKSTRLNSSHSV